MAGAITASTLTTVAVFLPIAFVGDLAGELFRPFALTVTMALLASLLVSLTIVPVLAYWFLKARRARPAAARRLPPERRRPGQGAGGRSSESAPARLPAHPHQDPEAPRNHLIAAALVLGGTPP